MPQEKGVIVGCDRKQEWLLPWWWTHYSKHNHYPVAFMDFGMSEPAIAWCRSKGIYVSLSFDALHEKEISPERKLHWEARTGEGIWFIRSGWLKKPFAFIHTPFPSSCWIDLDCAVHCDLAPLFQTLLFGIDLCIMREHEFSQRSDRLRQLTFDDEVTYNSGVVVFRKGAPLFHQWLDTMCKYNDLYMGDQNALSRMIYLHQPPLLELDPIYNWKVDLGENPKAKILHYSGDRKLDIIQQSIIY